MGLVKINGIKKNTNDLSYDEMTQLCDDFVRRKHRIPVNCEFNINQNLPGVMIFEKLLKEKNVSRDEFFMRYEEYNVIDFKAEHYDEYVELFKKYSYKEGHPIVEKRLKSYNLPCADWFVVHCPDKSVESWNGFVKWCGYKENNIVSKEVAERLLKDYDNNTDRPLTQNDLCKVGLSRSTIAKYWDSFSKCKQQLGLKLSPKGGNYKSFEDYKKRLDRVIQDHKSQGKYKITWNDILRHKYGGFNYDSLKNAFNKENIDVVTYIQNNGLTFWKSGQGKENYFCFPSGESVSSSYEYDLSMFLKSNNILFDRDYTRNTLYKDIVKTNLNNKIDCDYLFYDTFVVEIAGLISNERGDWHTYNYKSKREKDYQQKMIWKERLLKENDIPFLFLFPQDFREDSAYQPKIMEFIISNLHKYQFVKKINTVE